MMRDTRIPGLAAALLAVCATAAHATVLVPGSLADLVRDAQVIVCGRVTEVSAQWADGRRRIESVVVIEASGYLKGDYGGRLAFKVPGGAIGRYQSVMMGAPVFRPGDDVILFLGAEGPELPHLIGFSQGVLRLARDQHTGRLLVQPPPAAAARARTLPVRRGDLSRRPIPYEEFAARIQALMTPRASVAARPAARLPETEGPAKGVRGGRTVPDRKIVVKTP
jgi:hypothetical protein